MLLTDMFFMKVQFVEKYAYGLYPRVCDMVMFAKHATFETTITWQLNSLRKLQSIPKKIISIAVTTKQWGKVQVPKP